MTQKTKWKKICIGLLVILCMLGIFVFAISYLSTLGNQHRIAQLDAASDFMLLLEQEDQYQRREQGRFAGRPATHRVAPVDQPHVRRLI